ncbi:MAG: Holliday junction ATP-dependent DNA helicase RuvA [Parcubacteria group bacterium GW2011_GWB1_45_7]|nr:MAG: Holliday junction ATP-dependent DNA helicase RuvA [Parcubacteria group bacterium GW2011_GWB1_45_7]
MSAERYPLNWLRGSTPSSFAKGYGVDVFTYNRDMIHSLSGELTQKMGKFLFVGIGGVEFKVMVPATSESKLPKLGDKIVVYTFLHIREGGADLYGFLTEKELSFFELLISVSGIGPKSAVSILSVAPVDQLMAAVSRGEAEILQKSSGVGKKTSERIVLELKDKITADGDEVSVKVMESDNDVYDALINLGYSRRDARNVLDKIDTALTDTGDRLRDALKKIKN